MSTLTYSQSHLAAAEQPNAARDTTRPGFWRRVLNRVVAAQQRRADREIALFLSSHGGLMSDDMEREIMQRLSGGSRRSV